MRIFLLGASPSLGPAGAFPAVAGREPDSTADKLARTGGNTGNQIIAYGLLQSLQYDEVSWDHSIGPQRVNAEFDVIVVAAANFLHTGFDFAGMAAFIEATDLPCVMIGVGAQAKDYNPQINLLPGTQRLMRVVAERSKLIGARGPFTKEVLAAMGIHNVQVTGCPSHYMGGPEPQLIRKPALGNKPKLLINSSRDVVSHSFNRELMIENVCALLRLAVNEDADFVPQSELLEIKIAEAGETSDVHESFNALLRQFPFYGQVASRDVLLKWFSSHVHVFWDVALWYQAMKGYDFVLGNRFHGNMIALQAGTPACVICHDTRTSEMCEFLGLPSISLLDAGDFNFRDLYDLVEPEKIADRYRVLYPSYQSFLHSNGLIPRTRASASAAVLQK